MKLEQLVALIVRFFVLYVSFFVVFEYGMILVVQIAQYEGIINRSTAGFALLLVVLLVMGGLLWKYPLWVARKIIPETGGEPVKISLTFEQLQTLGFTLLGFWIAADSLVVALQVLLNVEVAKLHGAELQVRLFGYLARLVLGIWIILGANGISRVILRLRGKDTAA